MAEHVTRDLPRVFRTAAAFRVWLTRHHLSATELLVRIAKTHASHTGITYIEALDEALCFGWIDGVRRRIDESSFSIRFTPRKSKSKWSAVNIKHATRLEAAGRMHTAGLAAFRARKDAHSVRYSYEERPVGLDQQSLKQLKANKRAATYYQAQAPWYRRTTAFWVMSGKRPETRARRLGILIECSANQQRIDQVLSPRRP